MAVGESQSYKPMGLDDALLAVLPKAEVNLARIGENKVVPHYPCEGSEKNTGLSVGSEINI
jgi:hypothetical protein